jgi:hypothetical protein
MSAPPAPAASPSSAPAIPDIARQAARLDANLHAQTEYHAPSRNPFRFGVRPPRPVARTAPSIAVVSPPPPVEPPPPAIRLAGIADDVIDGATVRTAILTTPDSLHLAREGEMAGTYRVTKIGEESAELVAADGTTLTVALSR